MMVNKKWVKILKKARVLIEEDKVAYISSAIRLSKIGVFDFLYRDAKTNLQREIDFRLEGYEYPTFWMFAKHPDVYDQIAKDSQWQQYYLAWIDNMIEEFSGVHSSEFSGDNLPAPIVTWAD